MRMTNTAELDDLIDGSGGGGGGGEGVAADAADSTTQVKMYNL